MPEIGGAMGATTVRLGTSMPAQHSKTISMSCPSGSSTGGADADAPPPPTPTHVTAAVSADPSSRRGSRKDIASSSISPTRSHPQLSLWGEAATSDSWRCPGPTIHRAERTQSRADLCANSLCQAAYPIFMPAGEPRAHDYYSGGPRLEFVGKPHKMGDGTRPAGRSLHATLVSR